MGSSLPIISPPQAPAARLGLRFYDDASLDRKESQIVPRQRQPPKPARRLDHGDHSQGPERDQIPGSIVGQRIAQHEID
jgi:hypothetical protein